MINRKTGKILAVDDNTDILFALKLLLKRTVEEIDTEEDPEKIPKRMQQKNYDLILLDMNFKKDAISGQEGFSWLEKILEIDPLAVVIFITAYAEVANAVLAIKAGATDFIHKPWQNEKLLATISSGLRLRQSKMEVANLKERQKDLGAIINKPKKDFIGVSEGMLMVFETIQKVAKTDASILILGENGTGKELVARSLHEYSQRKDEIFVSVDLGAITETLFESELFGHIKGSFTDARADRAGRFEIASGGTLFLDEIGNLSLPLQAKLLTVLERREVYRIGSNTPIPIDIRLICATNMPLQQMIEEDKFREDLLYRINTVEVQIPPLRERIEDIPILAAHFITINAKRYKKDISGISKSALKELAKYPWPGNVREMQHAIERAIILTENKILQPTDFNLSNKTNKGDEIGFDSFNLEDIEKQVIKAVLRKCSGNISEASKELGITRTALYRRMEKHEL